MWWVKQKFHMISHVWNWTCGFGTCDFSHVKFHMWNYISHVPNSHVKPHTWNFTCEVSHVKHIISHVFTCEKSHVPNSHVPNSHVKLHMRNFTCQTHNFTCEISHVPNTHVKYHMSQFHMWNYAKLQSCTFKPVKQWDTVMVYIGSLNNLLIQLISTNV
jgi:hypothetical protein